MKMLLNWLRSWFAMARIDRSLSRTRKEMDDLQKRKIVMESEFLNCRKKLDDQEERMNETLIEARLLADDADKIVGKMDQALNKERAKIEVLEMQVEELTLACSAHQERWRTEVETQGVLRATRAGNDRIE